MKSSVIALLLVLALARGQPTQLQYNVGDQFSYQYNTIVDARGKTVTTNERTQGAWTTINGTFVNQVNDEDADSYLFVMNLFDNTFLVAQGNAGNYTDYEDGSLGDDMYYQQGKNGTIMNVWYESDDDPVMVNIKLGIIMSTQTYVVPPNQQANIQESDPIAFHSSSVSGFSSSTPNVALKLSKTWTQTNVFTFTDSSLKPENVNLQTTTTTAIHPSGYIYGSEIDEMVDFVYIGSGSSKPKSPKDTNPAVNTVMSSHGNTQVIMAPSASRVNSLQSGTFARLRDPILSQPYMQSNAFEMGINAAKQHKLRKLYEISPKFQLNKLFAESSSPAAAWRAHKKLVAASRVPGQVPLIESALRDMEPALNTLQKSAQARYFTLLAALAGHVTYAENQLVAKLTGSCPNMRKMAILGTHAAEKVPMKILNVLCLLANAGCAAENSVKIPQNVGLDEQRFALLAYGNLGGKVGGRKFTEISRQLKTLSRVDSPLANTARLALRNLHALTSQQPAPLTSQLPFNVSWSDSFTFGGDSVNVAFSAELFAGTNFDCNQPYFNYEGLAQAQATGTLFGISQSVFLSEAVYGKVNGAPLADELLLTVWNEVVYQQPIPQVDCAQHTYPIYQAAPGFDVEYTLWVSIVPITFEAAMNLDLDLTWGWQICDSSLLAEIQLTPTGVVSASGSAEIDLYIIKAGIELDAYFDQSIIPQGYIHGSECTIGFDVDQVSTPMNVNLESYFAYQSCTLFFFDCHWNDADQWVWLNWNYPAQNNILYQQQWKIASQEAVVAIDA